MSVSAIAMVAIRWLGKAFAFYRRNRVGLAVTLGAVKALGVPTKQLEKFAEGLIKIERLQGAHTSAWKEIAAAKKAKRAPELTAADGAYLYAFKKLFDRRIKRLFVKKSG